MADYNYDGCFIPNYLIETFKLIVFLDSIFSSSGRVFWEHRVGRRRSNEQLYQPIHKHVRWPKYNSLKALVDAVHMLMNRQVL